MRTRRAHPGGFTLLETLVALLIAAAGFGAVLSAVMQSNRGRVQAQAAERELALARTLMEQAFVGAMPREQASRVESGVERWTGQTNGLDWVVESRSTVMPAADLRRRGSEVGGIEGEQGGPVIAADLIRVDVGRITLTSARW